MLALALSLFYDGERAFVCVTIGLKLPKTDFLLCCGKLLEISRMKREFCDDQIMEFTIPELTGDVERNAYVYVPDEAEVNPDARYPVLYMFDGHNIFFDEDAPYGKSWDELIEKYRENMKIVERIPDALSGAMGNQIYVVNFSTKEETDAFYEDACRCV